MATAAQWIGGARPRTLPAALAPVAVGTGLAAYAASAVPVRAVLALVVAVALQVGVNYANDYSDGIKGTDAVRVGPVRLVGQGLAPPSRVRAAAFASFGVAAVAGLAVVALAAAWWLLPVGLASIAAAWLYTGGPRPYGYAGLGEAFVLVFFGIVPVTGTAYVQVLAVRAVDVVAGLAVGLLACAILVANNLRDIPGDSAAGKRTLAVRIGERNTRLLYVGSLAWAGLATVAVGLMSTPLAFAALLALLLGIPAGRTVMSGARGPALIAVLKQTGVLLLVYGLALGTLLAVG